MFSEMPTRTAVGPTHLVITAGLTEPAALPCHDPSDRSTFGISNKRGGDATTRGSSGGSGGSSSSANPDANRTESTRNPDGSTQHGGTSHPTRCRSDRRSPSNGLDHVMLAMRLRTPTSQNNSIAYP